MKNIERPKQIQYLQLLLFKILNFSPISYMLSVNKYDHRRKITEKKNMQIELQNKTDWIWNELRDFESYFIQVLLWILSAHTVWCSFQLGNHSPEIVMLRSANAKAYHHMIWQHLCRLSVGIPSQTEASYRTSYTTHHPKATENRKKTDTARFHTHSHKQTTLCLHCWWQILKDGSTKGHGMETVWNSSTSTF